jgi:hypothetical protein
LSIPRKKVDRLAALTIDALIDQMECAKKANKAVPAATLVAALKLLGSVDVARGDKPVIEPPKPRDEEEDEDEESEAPQAKRPDASKVLNLPFVDGKPNPAFDPEKARKAIRG